MADERRAVDDLAGAILDGAPVDWDAAESRATQVDRELIPHLRVVAGIAQAHRRGTAAVDMPLPATWAHLELRALMGSGAFGEVYSAWDTRLEREVALKLLNPDDRADGSSSPIAEGALLARVRHPNIVTVHGAERVDGRVGVWMELVDGRGLDRVLREQGPFSAHEASLVGLTVCRALSAVHRAGLLHRDVKAANVMREEGGRIVLMDFGTAMLVEDPVALAGTPLYVAPELLAGSPPTVSSDLYGVGVLLFHLATRSFPVRGTDLEDLRKAHADGRRRFLRDERPDLADDFIAVVEKSIAADLSARFQTAGAMEAALAAVVAGDERRRSARPRRWVMASLAAVGLAGVAFVALPRSWSTGLMTSAGGQTPPAAPPPASIGLPSSVVMRRVAFPPSMSAGRPSRDGTLFSFTTENGDLGLLEMPGLAARTLTVHEPGSYPQAASSAISSDNRLVAYTWRALDGRYEMRVIDADGRDPHVALRSDAIDEPQALEWSRDGSSILSVLVATDGARRLALVAPDGGVLKTVADLRATPQHASGSPGGGLFVFDDVRGESPDTTRDVFIVDGTGGEPRALAPHPADDIAPIWTPDGRGILFASDRSGTMDLWRQAVEDGGARGEPELVHRNIGRMRVLGLTDDGAYFYLSLVGATDVYSAELGPDGRLGPPRPLGTSHAGSNISSAWSPDGRRVAYASRRGLVRFDRRSTTLALVDLGRGEHRDLVPALSNFMVRSWSPDGSRVLVQGTDPGGRSGLFAIDVVSGAVAPVLLAALPSEEIGVGRGDWLPDGRILYMRHGTVRVRDLRSGTEEVVLDVAVEGIDGIDGGPVGRGFAMADDGTLAFSAWVTGEGVRTTALRLKPPGQPSRELLRVTGDERLVLQDLTPDGRTVLFTRRQPGQLQRLWRLDTGGGVPQWLNIDMKAVRDVSLHPDGRRITFTAGVPMTEVRVIEDVLSSGTRGGSNQ